MAKRAAVDDLTEGGLASGWGVGGRRDLLTGMHTTLGGNRPQESAEPRRRHAFRGATFASMTWLALALAGCATFGWPARPSGPSDRLASEERVTQVLWRRAPRPPSRARTGDIAAVVRTIVTS